MALEELQVSLFGSLPLGDRFERVDIPTDQSGQGDIRAALLSALDCPGELRLIFKLHFTMASRSDAEGALRWLQGPWRDSSEYERLRLLDRTYALTGDTAKQIDIRRNAYLRTPGIPTYRALAELLPEGERAELRTRACAEAMTNPDVAAAAELLFELNEPKLADKLIIERAAELNGGFYGSLTSLVEKARNEGCFLAATLILRALLDAILKRAYAKAYGHGARYLRALQELGSRIDDYRGHPTHEVYEQTPCTTESAPSRAKRP